MNKTFDKLYFLDTNIILEDATQLISISENGKNLIILPETVIDELDAKKSGFDEINFQAREFARMLSEAEILNTKTKIGALDIGTIVSLKVDDIYINLVSMDNYISNDSEKSIRNDRKIIEAVSYFSEYYNNQNIVFLTNDIMCRTRAIAKGIESEGIEQNKDTLSPEFIKVIENVDSQVLIHSNEIDITEIDPDWKPENYCYHIKADNGNERIGYVVDGYLSFIKDNDFSGLHIQPKNLGQKYALTGMLDPDIDVCVVEALAGSGKTLLAIAAGMQAVTDGDYNKIVYIRNSVESTDKAEEVGFLSGNEEKFKIYNYPLYDTLEFIAQVENSRTTKTVKNSNVNSAKVEELIKRYNIETFWIGSSRGRNISGAYVIIDEVQNFSKPSLRTTMTRIDESCKVVCVGSNRQIDHPFVNKYTNGLNTLLKALKEEDNSVVLFGTELTKVVRGKITEFAERIFDK